METNSTESLKLFQFIVIPLVTDVVLPVHGYFKGILPERTDKNIAGGMNPSVRFTNVPVQLVSVKPLIVAVNAETVTNSTLHASYSVVLPLMYWTKPLSTPVRPTSHMDSINEVFPVNSRFSHLGQVHRVSPEFGLAEHQYGKLNIVLFSSYCVHK